MPYSELSQDELRRRAGSLQRAIDLKTFECACIDALGHAHLDRADLGWVMSIAAGAAGTLTAVSEGKRYCAATDRLDRLQDELQLLRNERDIIESWLDT